MKVSKIGFTRIFPIRSPFAIPNSICASIITVKLTQTGNPAIPRDYYGSYMFWMIFSGIAVVIYVFLQLMLTHTYYGKYPADRFRRSTMDRLPKTVPRRFPFPFRKFTYIWEIAILVIAVVIFARERKN